MATPSRRHINQLFLDLDPILGEADKTLDLPLRVSFQP